ncbi:MAG: hypothetical protein ACQERN_04150 [Thermodesulfobacteriota bacterium]
MIFGETVTVDSVGVNTLETQDQPMETAKQLGRQMGKALQENEKTP